MEFLAVQLQIWRIENLELHLLRLETEGNVDLRMNEDQMTFFLSLGSYPSFVDLKIVHGFLCISNCSWTVPSLLELSSWERWSWSFWLRMSAAAIWTPLDCNSNYQGSVHEGDWNSLGWDVGCSCPKPLINGLQKIWSFWVCFECLETCLPSLSCLV